MTREIPNPITKEFLEAEAQSIKFTHITGTLTHCAITVEGGFIFTGESACADPANYDPVIGEQYAYEKAIDSMWLPYGFLLKHQLMEKERDVLLAPKTSKERHILATPSDIQLSAGDRELTVQEIEKLASGQTLCDCCEFVSDEDSHPVQPGDHFDFGTAISLLKRGERVMRAGWNGKNMWLILIEADQYGLTAWKYFNATELLPFIAMKTADNKIVPWLASQTDMLATDWVLV